jgi:hypothetical protein
MSFDLSVAGTAIPTDISALKGFQNDLNLAFGLDETLKSVLDATLSQVPSSKTKSPVTYKGNEKTWRPGMGPVTFGLQATAGGTVEILSSGQILTYTDGLETQTQKSIAVPSGTAYVKLTLNFTLGGNATANWSGGAYGVKSSVDGEQTYAISFCKAFAPSTVVREALAESFTAFVLPFHAETLQQMCNGDLLQYAFDGNLHLAFGAYAGLDKVLYAGQSSVDVLQAMGSKMATFSVKPQPEIQANASLDFSYQYAAQFEALLSKLEGVAHLHVFRSAKSDLTTTLGAMLQFDGDTTASIATHQDELATSIVAAAGGAATPQGTVLQAALNAASSETGKYVAEVNDKLTAWLNKANGRQANLQVAIESTKSRTILAGYAFNLKEANYPAAWEAAVNGDLVKALATGAVTLDAGSGLEQEYHRKTSCELNVFNLWHWNSWNEFSSKMQLVYAGNNRFHLTANVGRTTETDAAGTMQSIEFYFAAEADVDNSGTVSSLDVDLHVQLTASRQPKEAQRIATILGALNAGATADALYHEALGFASRKDGILQLQITIPMQAIQIINSDTPDSGSFVLDAKNWNAFAAAADSLPGAWALRENSAVSTQTLQFLKTYPAWEDLNRACTGGDKPDKIHFGNRSVWPPEFPNVDQGMRALLTYSMFAGQSFMNFCAALHDLVRVSDTGSTNKTWEKFMKILTDAVKLDTSTDFIRPTTLALLRLCMTPTAKIAGPAPATTPTNHLTITIDL